MTTRGTSQHQYFSGAVITSAANAYTEDVIDLPIEIGSAANNKIIEIEKIDVDVPVFVDGGATATLWAGWHLRLGSATTLKGLADPFVVETGVTAFRLDHTSDSSVQQGDTRVRRELEDEKGHGFLVANNKLYFGVDTFNFSGTAGFNYRIYYRFAKVGAAQYFSILTSQQNVPS